MKDNQLLIVLAFISGLPALVASVASVIVGIKTGTKANDMVVKTQEVHELVNNQMTALKTELATANSFVNEVKVQLAEANIANATMLELIKNTQTINGPKGAPPLTVIAKIAKAPRAARARK